MGSGWCKTLHVSCVSTVFASKAVPFLAVIRSTDTEGNEGWVERDAADVRHKKLQMDGFELYWCDQRTMPYTPLPHPPTHTFDQPGCACLNRVSRLKTTGRTLTFDRDLGPNLVKPGTTRSQLSR